MPIAEVAEELRLADLLSRPYGKLSAGQKTRVSLAKALINEPELLLLDEPTASLDPDTADWVRSKLEAYCQMHAATVVLASHNMAEVERLAGRVIMLEKGRIIADETPRELIDLCSYAEQLGRERLSRGRVEVAIRVEGGGMGAITQAMAKAAIEHGAEIEIQADVNEVLIERNKVVGVTLQGGRVVRGRALAANLNLKLLYTRLVPSSSLPPEFLTRMKAFKCISGSFRMNVALSKLPSFTVLPGTIAQVHHGAGIIIGPSLAYMDRAYRDAKETGWSREPVIEMVIPSTFDSTLAPPGAHVASLFCQHVAPELPNGRSWEDAREEVADLIIETLDRYAPGFSKSVIARQSLSPLDLERDFGLVGGDIFHGSLSLNQLFSARPMLGYADYRGPIRGLYHCGSGAHPGGGVTGAPGHNAAKAILSDLRLGFSHLQ